MFTQPLTHLTWTYSVFFYSKSYPALIKLHLYCFVILCPDFFPQTAHSDLICNFCHPASADQPVNAGGYETIISLICSIFLTSVINEIYIFRSSSLTYIITSPFGCTLIVYIQRAVECLNLIGWGTFWGVQLFSGKCRRMYFQAALLTTLQFRITRQMISVISKVLQQKNNQNPLRATAWQPKEAE